MAAFINLFSYCLGGALFSAAIFFPLTFVAMKSSYRLQGSLGRAWRPFGYSLMLLTLAQFVELATKSSHDDVLGTMGLVWFLLVPISVCAAVLYFTYRDKGAPPPQEPTSGM
jgi:hypothetical protein